MLCYAILSYTLYSTHIHILSYIYSFTHTLIYYALISSYHYICITYCILYLYIGNRSGVKHSDDNMVTIEKLLDDRFDGDQKDDDFFDGVININKIDHLKQSGESIATGIPTTTTTSDAATDSNNMNNNNNKEEVETTKNVFQTEQGPVSIDMWKKVVEKYITTEPSTVLESERSDFFGNIENASWRDATDEIELRALKRER